MAGGARVIAVDGPVAAGKTSVGRELARRLGYKFLDTGIMYRAVTWLALKRQVPMEDEAALGELARRWSIRPRGRDSDRVLVGELVDELVGEPVSEPVDEVELGEKDLRDPQVDQHVSLVSRVSEVRRAMVRQQRELAAAGEMVMVGRDIGTVVLPDAGLKVFISASVEERASRRCRELLGQGHSVRFDQVLRDLQARDQIDSNRADSPLLPAEDAFRMDTDGRSIDEVVDLILAQACPGSQKAEQ